MILYLELCLVEFVPYRIIAESEVAKMTFYKHFPAKADLISAYLKFKHEARFHSLQKYTTAKSPDPYKQILGVFDSLKEWFEGRILTDALLSEA